MLHPMKILISHLSHTKQQRLLPRFWYTRKTLTQNEQKSLKLIDHNAQKVLLAMERNLSHLPKSNLINFRTHRKSCGY